MAKKSWSELTPTQQKVVVVAGIAEVVLSTYCLRDLNDRPASQVRGSKWFWRPALAVQPIGPLAYLLLGRRRGA